MYLLCRSHFKTNADISVNLRSASPPCAVKAQPTECGGEKSFWFTNTFKCAQPPSCCAQLHNPHPYVSSKHKQWQRADMKFPFLCLLTVMMKFTHSTWLTHRKWSVERAVESIQLAVRSVISCVICYHCCGRLIYDCHRVTSANLINGPWWRGLMCVSIHRKRAGHVRLKRVAGYKLL